MLNRVTKHVLFSLPVAGRRLKRRLQQREFFRQGSAGYWEKRYREGGTSGDGSAGQLAAFKAAVINGLVSEQNIDDVLELGCGDGSQLTLARYPRYRGYDVSATAVTMCRQRFSHDSSKSFDFFDALRFPGDIAGREADLALSLDVIYHLVEDDVFEAYMRCLTGSSNRWLLIYSSNFDESRDTRVGAVHVRHRCFTDWLTRETPQWQLVRKVENPFGPTSGMSEMSFADFYLFRLERSDG